MSAAAIALTVVVGLWPIGAGPPGHIAGGVGPVQHQSPVPTPGPAGSAVGQGLSPEVAALPAHSSELDAAASTLDRAVATRDRDQRELTAAEASLASSTESARATSSLQLRHRALLSKTDSALDRRRDALRGLAAEWYAAGTAGQRSFDPTLAPDELEELRRQEVLGAAAAAQATGAIRFLEARSRQLRSELDSLGRTIDQLSGRVAEQADRVQHLRSAVETDVAAVSGAEARVAAARVGAVVDGTDLPTLSLDAYWRAEQAMSMLQPACGLTWWVLAGIGRTESRHGTYLGSRPTPGGSIEPPILGPPLDGTNGFRRVPDSDRGLLDGDAASDRAVGPMQFLPSTWRTVGRDGNGDGVADPDNIYDAALGAAAYLCRAGAVADEAGMRRAYFSYNRSQTYVDAVTGLALGYRDAVALPGPAARTR